MARTAKQDWGFDEITRKFERDARPSRRPRPSAGRRWLPVPSVATAHVGVWLTMVALALIGLVALHVILMQKDIQYSGLILQRNALTSQNAQLSGEVSTLRSPARIEQIATSLGMSQPKQMQYLYIGPADSGSSYAELGQRDPGGISPP